MPNDDARPEVTPDPSPPPEDKFPTKLKLKNPVEIDGKTLTVLNLDPETIPKKEYSKIKLAFRQKYGRQDNTQSIGLDERFQNMLIARLNEITPEGFVDSLNVEDEEAAHMILNGFFQVAGLGRMIS